MAWRNYERERETMPIELPKGVPFSVDTWSPSSKKKRHHFLSHAHTDHFSGISAHLSFPTFCTAITKSLLLQQFPKLDGSAFVGIEAGDSVVLDDPDGSFSVTALDANHCPGAAMFLFEGRFGNILHTGDCRLTVECLQNLPSKYLGKNGEKPRCSLDYVFLDCTFGKFYRAMPSKHAAIRQVIDCIWKHPDSAVVYLTSDLLGQEEILVSVSKTFGSKIYVDKAANPESFHALTLIIPEIISEDRSSRFHLLDGFPKLKERAKELISEARAKSEQEPLIIRPSSMWYACEDEFKPRMDMAIRDCFGIWHVCFSIHSSREELEWALRLLAPKWVISTTPNCLATELEYVKKHCLAARLSHGGPLWKLLDINVEAPKSEVLDPHESDSQKQPLNLSPESKRVPVTLFGRARLGLHEPSRSLQKKITKDDEVSCEAIAKEPSMITVEKESEISKENEQSFVGSSKNYSERMRKLYRSMNVPVPQPLPSLMEILKSTKRVKRVHTDR